MVHWDGGSTMLGQWRIVLRQAEESARAGRFVEALNLAGRPDVADHRQAVILRAKLARELTGRAERRGSADDLAGAIGDLALAERFGAAPDLVAKCRLKLAENVVGEVRAILEAGDPVRALERIDALARDAISGPSLRRLRESADAWKTALEDLRRGEFGLAREGFDRAERLAGAESKPALDVSRRDLDRRRSEAHPRTERLYKALESGHWGAALAAADDVLELVPDHPAAKQARTRAWQQIGGTSPSAKLSRRPGSAPVATLGSPEPVQADAGIVFLSESPRRVARLPVCGEAVRLDQPERPADRSRNALTGRVLLWVDAVGGYLVCFDDQLLLGRDGPGSRADIPLLGDLSRNHADIIRTGEGYVLRARQPTFINGRAAESAALRSGDVVRLGSSVELEFRQPSPVSSTARLELLSRHRLPLSVGGVILMGETCIMGRSAQAHITAPDLDRPVVLFRQGATLWCKADGPFEVDGRPCEGRAPLTLGSSVRGENFSFSLEPLDAQTPASGGRFA
jgi:hypothetical protein